MSSALLDRPPAAPAPGPAPARTRSTGARVALQVAIALTFVLVLVVGFATYLYGLSGLSEQRTQTTLRKSFAYELGQAIAPIGPTTEGSPVAVLDIPQIGLHDAVIVEGTSAHDLTRGPGHRADTVLPGEAGVSVVYGRAVTFGAPFRHLMRLQVGDRFTATTGLGVATYRVSSFGDGDHPAPANTANRIVLTTADSLGAPHDTISVSADLVTPVLASAGALPVVPDTQKGLTIDTSGLVTALLWSQVLLALVLGATFAAHRWSAAATWLVAAPLAIGVLWSLFENLAGLLPNLY